MRFSDKFGIIAISLVTGGIISMFMFFFDGVREYVSWGSFFLISILASPIVYFSMKGSSTCPACKKAWKEISNGQETIREYPVTKTENEGYGDQRRSVVNTYIHREYWQFHKCEACNHEWKTKENSETKA